MKKLLIVLTGALLFSCAKERPIEKLNKMGEQWLSKDLFTGSNNSKKPDIWYQKTTVVKTSNNAGFAYVGQQSKMKVGYFSFTEDRLKFFSSKEMYKKSGNNLPTLINEWSIVHRDIMLQESGGKVSNVEVEDDRKEWSDKKYFTADFTSAVLAEGAQIPWGIGTSLQSSCWNQRSSHVQDDSLDVQSDYISFVVSVNYELNFYCNDDFLRNLGQDYSFSVDYRYSFKKRKENKKYTKFVYAKGFEDPARKQFGYFQTYNTKLNENNNEYVNEIFINRWDPEKNHNYYFTKDFPDKWKWIFNDPKKGIFPLLNDFFKKAKIPTRFYIRENDWGDGKAKEFGDLRYSFVNIVQEKSPSAPLGLGPSDADPFSGEILAANIILWTSSLKYYVKTIAQQEFIDSKGDSSLTFNMKNFLGIDNLNTLTNSLASADSKIPNIFHHIVKEKTFAHPGANPFLNVAYSGSEARVNSSREDKLTELMSMLNFPPHTENVINNLRKDFDKSMRDTSKQIHNGAGVCEYPVLESVSNLSSTRIKEKGVEKVVADILYSVAIHEVGHTLGLRHNFYGSVDSKNFKPLKEGDDFGSVSSSVMDYFTLSDEANMEHDWGNYDYAALAYSYSNSKINWFPKFEFLYCTDEHTYFTPMCQRWDKGDTPSKIILNSIKSYDRMYYLRNFRNGRTFWDTRHYAWSVFNQMISVKSFLSYWLTSLSESSVVEILAKLGMNQSSMKYIHKSIEKEMISATKLSLAFYQSIINLSDEERDWGHKFTPFTGEVERIGILPDKFYSMIFLLGDNVIATDLSAKNLASLSYLALRDKPNLAPYIDKAFAQDLSFNQSDIEDEMIEDLPISMQLFGRVLYSMNATSYTNRGDTRLIDKMKINKLDARELKEYFGLILDSEFTADEFVLEKSTHPEFSKGESVGIVEIKGSYYVASKANSPYSFSMISKIKEVSILRGVAHLKYEVVQTYKLYQFVTLGE